MHCAYHVNEDSGHVVTLHFTNVVSFHFLFVYQIRLISSKYNSFNLIIETLSSFYFCGSLSFDYLQVYLQEAVDSARELIMTGDRMLTVRGLTVADMDIFVLRELL